MAADKPVILAIDTSTEMSGLALYSGSRISELIWHSGRNQTVSLLNQVQHLLDANRLSLNDVGAVSVATGPGTFNGLRVGLSTAKGLGFGRAIPVFGVDTLEATAYPHRSSRLPIRAFVAAGRGRVVLCDYRQRNERWMRMGDLQNRPFAELADGLSETTLLTGEAPQTFDLADLEQHHLEIPRLSLRARRPASFAEIAWARWHDGAKDELASLEPLYVHGARSPS